MNRIIVDCGKMIEIRIKSGFTQNSLARASDTSSTFISRLEAGKANPRPSNAVKICKALNVGFDELFSIAGAEPEAAINGNLSA